MASHFHKNNSQKKGRRDACEENSNENTLLMGGKYLQKQAIIVTLF